MGNHPDHQTTEANQWPHHFNMLGQLLLGFIFMIVVFFLYVTHYLRGKRADRLRRGKASSVSGAMEGGGVAGLAQMRAKLSGKNIAYERLGGGGLGAAEEGSSNSRSGGLKRTGSGSLGNGTQGGGGILESVRYVEGKQGGSR